MSATLQKALGQQIRALRKAQGFSQEGFADNCGVHRTFMGALERGETNISFDNLAKIATGLHLTLAKMLDGLETMTGALPLPPALEVAAPARVRRVRRQKADAGGSEDESIQKAALEREEEPEEEPAPAYQS